MICPCHALPRFRHLKESGTCPSIARYADAAQCINTFRVSIPVCTVLHTIPPCHLGRSSGGLLRDSLLTCLNIKTKNNQFMVTWSRNSGCVSRTASGWTTGYPTERYKINTTLPTIHFNYLTFLAMQPGEVHCAIIGNSFSLKLTSKLNRTI